MSLRVTLWAVLLSTITSGVCLCARFATCALNSARPPAVSRTGKASPAEVLRSLHDVEALGNATLNGALRIQIPVVRGT